MQMLTSFQPVILQPVRCGSSEGKGHVSKNKGDVKKDMFVCKVLLHTPIYYTYDV